MRFRTILSLATFFLTCFTIAAWSQPLSSAAATENQSVSGKISSVGDASFAIDVIRDNQTPQTVQFFVDDKTKVEGKLNIGAKAVVEYRADSGKNIAVHVVVTPSSGVRPH